MIDCLRFFIGHPGFLQNLTYQLLHVYNQNKDQIYNKIHTGNSCWEKQINFLVGVTIIPILIVSDKTIISLSHGDQVLWPVYVIIDYLDAKICQS